MNGITTAEAIKSLELSRIGLPLARDVCDKAIAALRAQQEAENLSADRDAWQHIADAAVRDLHSVIKQVDGCSLCAHYYPCAGKDCPKYISGTGANNPDGTEDPDFKWTCEDFDFGTCPALENMPCNGCDFENHWEWRGLCKENEGGDTQNDQG